MLTLTLWKQYPYRQGFVKFQGQVFPMTGHGFNDVTILSDADMGVPMGKKWKDVERYSSGTIFSYRSFPTFIVAVKNGRVV